MQHVKLTKPHTAALDGVTAVDYPKGSTVLVSDEVAEHWIARGLVADPNQRRGRRGRRAATAADHQEKLESAPTDDDVSDSDNDGDEADGPDELTDDEADDEADDELGDEADDDAALSGE